MSNLEKQNDLGQENENPENEVEINFGMTKIFENILSKMEPSENNTFDYACIREIYGLYGEAIHSLCKERAKYRFDPEKVEQLPRIEFCIKQVLLSLVSTISSINSLRNIPQPAGKSKRRASVKNANLNEEKGKCLLSSKEVVNNVKSAVDNVDNAEGMKKNKISIIDDCNSQAESKSTPSKFIVPEKAYLVNSSGPTFMINMELGYCELIPIFSLSYDDDFNVKSINKIFVPFNDTFYDCRNEIKIDIKSTILKRETFSLKEDDKSISQALGGPITKRSQFTIYRQDEYESGDNYYEPDLGFILHNYFVQNNKRCCFYTKGFVIIREVNYTILKEDSGEKEEETFIEPVFCYIASQNSKNDIAFQVNEDDKYKILAYYVTKENDKFVIRGFTLCCDSPYKSLYEVLREKIHNSSFQSEFQKNPIVKDRRMCIKLKLPQSDDHSRLFESQKEYQTTFSLKQRLSNFSLIVEKESRYIRYKFDFEPLVNVPKRESKSEGKKSRKSSVSSKRSSSVSKRSSSITRSPALVHNAKIKIERNLDYLEANERENVNALISKKSFKYKVLSNSSVVYEDVFEPNILEVGKHFSGTIGSEKSDKAYINKIDCITVGNSFGINNFNRNIFNKVEIQPRVELKSDVKSEYKPKTDDEREAVRKVRGLFQFTSRDAFDDFKYSDESAEKIAVFVGDKLYSDKVILKNVFISPEMGIIDESEIKNNILKNAKVPRVNGDFFPTKTIGLSAEATQNLNDGLNTRWIKNFEIQETAFTRVLMNHVKKNLRPNNRIQIEVHEPNLIACLLYLCPKDMRDKLFPREMKRFPQYEKRLDEHFTGLSKQAAREPILVENYKNYSQHDRMCPYRKYGSFIIVSRKKFLKIIDEDITVVEDIFEPKVVRMFCLECSTKDVCLEEADTFHSWASFTRKSQLIDFFDILYSLRALSNDCEYAHNQNALNQAYSKYRQHIQRFLQPMKS